LTSFHITILRVQMQRPQFALLAMAVAMLATCVHAGVEIETIKAGDGVNFPPVGKVVSPACCEAWLLAASACGAIVLL
jgi:hypothetical protein